MPLRLSIGTFCLVRCGASDSIILSLDALERLSLAEVRAMFRPRAGTLHISPPFETLNQAMEFIRNEKD